MTMPRICTICTHEEKTAIDEALVAGTSTAEISALFRVSDDAVDRHKATHLPATLVKAHQAQEVARADSLINQLRDLQARTLSILGQAEKAGERKTALAAIREARGNLELLAKMLGELDETPQVSVLIGAVVEIVKANVEDYEARQRIADELGRLLNLPPAG